MDALGLLALQIEWGAEEALAELPVRRLLAHPAAPVRAAVAPAATLVAAPGIARPSPAGLPTDAAH